MDFAALIRSRLKALGYDQKDLARAAQVTDSYISQLLTRRKAPPSRDRTDIYGRMEVFLELGKGELTRLVETGRAEELKRRLGETPQPLHHRFRELVLRKCLRDRRDEIGVIFKRAPYGTLERLVARTILDVVQGIARRELELEDWLQLAARVGRRRSKEEMRSIVLDFLDTDVYQVSSESCVAFLEPILESWTIDLESFTLRITLNPDLVDEPHRTLAFVEAPDPSGSREEPGLADFLADRGLSGDISEEEVRLLRLQRFGARRPGRLYYYRALQNLRDPLHFLPAGRAAGRQRSGGTLLPGKGASAPTPAGGRKSSR